MEKLEKYKIIEQALVEGIIARKNLVKRMEGLDNNLEENLSKEITQHSLVHKEVEATINQIKIA